MRISLIIGGFLLALLLAGLTYVGLADIRVETSQVTKTIPNTRFFE